MEGHFLSAGTVLEKLGSEKNGGLTDAEAKRRLEKEGENKLTEKKKTSLIKKFFEQFKDFCVIILFVACIISFATGVIEGSGDFVEPIVILAIVILNAVIGVYQENRAEKAIEALKKMSAPSATVKRSGKIKKIPASQLVKGDIILLAGKGHEEYEIMPDGIHPFCERDIVICAAEKYLKFKGLY